MDMMPAGLSGPNAQKLGDIFNLYMKSGVLTSQTLASLQDINFATGENLRRIGTNLGFSFVSDDDAIYRRNLCGFIALKSCNGAAGGVYWALSIFGLKISHVDIYETFNTIDGTLLDASRMLDSTWRLDGVSDNPDFATHVDFHREFGDLYPGGEGIVRSCRPPARLVVPREVFELNPKNSSTVFDGTLLLDAGWALDASKRLNPFREGAVCKLVLNGTIVEESTSFRPSLRVNGREWDFTTQNEFSSIEIWDLAEQLAEFKLLDPTRFYMQNKIVTWRFSDV